MGMNVSMIMLTVSQTFLIQHRKVAPIVADFHRAKGLYSGKSQFIERRGCLGNETETIDPDVVFEDALMPKIFGQKIFKQGSNAYHWYDEKSQNESFPFMVLGNDFHFRTFTLNTELMCGKVPCLVASVDRNQLCKPTVDNTGKRFDKNPKLPIIFSLKSYEQYLSNFAEAHINVTYIMIIFAASVRAR